MKKLQHSSQDGFVSIMVAMIIMMFVALIGLGFAFLANQNQVQNQNRILNTQAFYAAESGVNDTVDYLSKYLATNGILPAAKTDCNSALPAPYTTSLTPANPAIAYTCVLFDPAPSSLEYNVGTNESTIVRVQAQSNTNIKTINISWQDSQGSKNFASNVAHQLPQDSLWGGATGDNLALNTGILRTTIIPVLGSISRADLSGPNSKAQTLFLYPLAGAANTTGNQAFLNNTNINNASQGTFVDGHCNSVGQNLPKYCNVSITGLDTLPGVATPIFYLRLRGLYRSAAVTISATDGTGPAKLISEQAMIDSTGKANDVLRRIQVRVPLSIASNRPENAVESIDSLCKRLMVWPGGANVDWQTIPNGSGGSLSSQPDTCKAY